MLVVSDIRGFSRFKCATQRKEGICSGSACQSVAILTLKDYAVRIALVLKDNTVARLPRARKAFSDVPQEFFERNVFSVLRHM